MLSAAGVCQLKRMPLWSSTQPAGSSVAECICSALLSVCQAVCGSYICLAFLPCADKGCAAAVRGVQVNGLPRQYYFDSQYPTVRRQCMRSWQQLSGFSVCACLSMGPSGEDAVKKACSRVREALAWAVRY